MIHSSPTTPPLLTTSTNRRIRELFNKATANTQSDITWVFLFAGKDNDMTEKKTNKSNDDVIMVTDEAGMQLYLSEKAANRLSWVITGILALISLPVFILAFMSL